MISTEFADNSREMQDLFSLKKKIKMSPAAIVICLIGASRVNMSQYLG